MTQPLQGVKDREWLGSPERARRLAEALARRGEVAYCAEPPQSSPPEQRLGTRNRTRLRSAKILDGAGRFLSECRVHDVSPSGLQLALQRNVGLPKRFLVHDDDSGETRVATLVWRRGANVGARLVGEPAKPLRPSERFALKARYYAMRD